MSVEENKRLVARAVTEVINGGDLAAIEQLYAPDIAAAARDWVTPFRAAFPDVRMETVALVGEGDTVVGHFRCSGTHTGPWRGRPGTGRAFRNVREVYWFTVRDGRIMDWWGLEDDDDRRRQLRADRPVRHGGSRDRPPAQGRPAPAEGIERGAAPSPAPSSTGRSGSARPEA